jgi:hypothetical protein
MPQLRGNEPILGLNNTLYNLLDSQSFKEASEG